MRAVRSNAMVVLLCMALGATGALAQEAEAPVDPVLEVAEIGAGTDWDAVTRELIGESDVFPAGVERLVCRTLITGADEPTTITHVWYRDGKTMARVELPVRSSHWRTYSSKRLLPDWTGAWEVKVLDAAGTVLGSTAFTVE
jgi:hypothetical protein